MGRQDRPCLEPSQNLGWVCLFLSLVLQGPLLRMLLVSTNGLETCRGENLE